MFKSLKTDLPASFRVTGFRSQAFGVRDLIEGTYFSALAEPKEGENLVDPLLSFFLIGIFSDTVYTF